MSEPVFNEQQMTAVRQFAQMVRLSAERQRLMPNAASFQRTHGGTGGHDTTYDGARRYSTVLGRKAELEFQDYYSMYDRGGLAGTIIDVRADDTWGEPPAVTEDDNEDTEFVQAPCFKDAGLWEKRKGLNPTIGGWLVDAQLSSDLQALESFSPQLFTF